MKAAGIDIGSRYIKYIVLEEARPVLLQKKETGHNPLAACLDLINSAKPDRLVATGYGRYLLEVHGSIKTHTEIKAVARGAKEAFPSCRTVIDIGGQDTKVISLGDSGAVSSFEMNDRCAAGTGRFLEIMARALGYDLDNFGAECSGLNSSIRINSMCTVFAESEVVGLIARGVKREIIANSLHSSVVSKVTALIKKVGMNRDVVFAGGCARNRCLARMFEEQLQCEVLIHEHPDFLAALGAALYAAEMKS